MPMLEWITQRDLGHPRWPRMTQWGWLTMTAKWARIIQGKLEWIIVTQSDLKSIKYAFYSLLYREVCKITNGLIFLSILWVLNRSLGISPLFPSTLVAFYSAHTLQRVGIEILKGSWSMELELSSISLDQIEYLIPYALYDLYGLIFPWGLFHCPVIITTF